MAICSFCSSFFPFEVDALHLICLTILIFVKLETRDGKAGWCAREWKKTADRASRSEVKFTIPGPMTITNSTAGHID